MKKLLLSNFLILIATLSFSQATKTSLGLGFSTTGWYSTTPPAAITSIAVTGGKLVFTCDSLNQYAPLNYRLNDGVAGNKDSLNFSSSNSAYLAIWASATQPVAIRIDFLNSSKPGCLCPQDRAANKSGQKTPAAFGTTIQGQLQPAVTDWNQDFTTNNGPVDNTSITHLNIYVVPQKVGATNYSGTISIDSIYISVSPIILGINDHVILVNSTHLFPNPVSEKATLDYTLLSAANMKLVLFDVTGRQVGVVSDSHAVAGNNHVEFDVTKYAKGVYTIAFLVNGSSVQTEKLVIQ